MKKRKNKTVIGTIGVILTLFGLILTIPTILNKDYMLLILTGISAIVGVILIAWSFTD
tara:strand:+ start:330 stop:503 length:174 start_codon:yes stop_codon:yes gene_type:complete